MFTVQAGPMQPPHIYQQQQQEPLPAQKPQVSPNDGHQQPKNETETNAPLAKPELLPESDQPNVSNLKVSEPTPLKHTGVKQSKPIVKAGRFKSALMQLTESEIKCSVHEMDSHLNDQKGLVDNSLKPETIVDAVNTQKIIQVDVEKDVDKRTNTEGLHLLQSEMNDGTQTSAYLTHPDPSRRSPNSSLQDSDICPRRW